MADKMPSEAAGSQWIKDAYDPVLNNGRIAQMDRADIG